MIRIRAPLTAACCAALLGGPVSAQTAAPLPSPSLPPAVPNTGPSAPAPHVNATIVTGTGAYPPPPTTAPAALRRPGPITLNFPGVDVQDVAKAVLGDILDLPYTVDPSVHGPVTLVTAHPIARADVLPAVEDALTTAGFALELRNGSFIVAPLAQARTQAPTTGADQPGFGNETVTLRFASPAELKTLLDPIVPGVITAADPASNTLVLSGTSGQRKAVRELVQQFDVDWLKGMSFALYMPQNTDARLIAPELDKLINAPGAPTAGMVRLVAMDRLNGIVAISPQRQYLDDVRRWVEVLDREGQSTERRLYVYRVQNGRAADLAQVLIAAFGGGTANGSPNGASASAAGQRSGIGGGPSLAAGANSSAFGAQGGSGSLFGSASSSSLNPASLASGQTLPGQSPTAVTPASGRVGGGPDSLVVTSDETNNAVVAYATPREYALIEDALRKLDIAPLQVVIEAAITEVDLNDALQYGTQFFFQTHGNTYGLTQGTTAAEPTTNLPGVFYTFSPGASIAATISALSSVSHVDVLSAPNLLVLNNQTASLEVGDEVPISTGSSTSTLTADAPVVNSIDYRDVGVILKVTPRVNASGLVLLDISQEVSSLDNTAQSNPTSSTLDSPTFQERKIASSIAVQDGQTVALGGLIQDTNTKDRSGIPVLSAIPVVGGLFGSINNTRARTELLVLLTPRVIRSPDEAQAVTDELRRKIREINPIRPRFEP